MAIVNDNSDAVFAQLEQEQDNFLSDLLTVGTGYIKQETPVKTGNLRDHNEHELTGQGEGRWFNDVEYAGPVEFGHPTKNGGHTSANPFMQRGLDRLTVEAEQIAGRHFSNNG
jgi:hypothetical protein